MITELKLNNFKSHQHTTLNMKPLTLISGVNNIGKSSVLQALLLLRQTFKKGILSKGLDLNNRKRCTLQTGKWTIFVVWISLGKKQSRLQLSRWRECVGCIFSPIIRRIDFTQWWFSRRARNIVITFSFWCWLPISQCFSLGWSKWFPNCIVRG